MRMSSQTKHDIGPVLEHYGLVLPYGRNGWVKVKCCFHDDSHASAAVNFQKNEYHCFACDVHGDTYDIIQEREGIDFVKAIEFAQRISPESSGGVQQGPSSRSRLSNSKRVVAGRRGSVLDGSSGQTASRSRSIRR